nr:hypothetical protein CFP56_78520 [Quercus suber]
MARRLLCLALFDHRSRRTAGLASCPSDGFYLPNDYAGLNSGEDILQRMLDHGSRFSDLSHSWTKILPKGETKPAFKTFIRNSTQNEVAALAERYTPLCNTLLQWYLRQLIPSGLSSNTLTPNSEGLMVHLGATTDSPMSYEPLGLTFASDQSLLQCEDAIDSFTTFDESFVGGFEF